MNIQRREPDRQINNLREAAGILKLEAAGSPYGHLAATVQHNIADLSQYIESVKNMWTVPAQKNKIHKGREKKLD